ncbi:MAG: hypothetical protein DI605_18965 [Sphingomonas sp.]|nr:MAG: hypothetical protein DI605_18965 [Sphingomonas sp.]
MADRVSATITIGGTVPAALLADFIALVVGEGLSTEWDGPEFAESELRGDDPLQLMAHEVAWGRFEELEAFCAANALPFARWSGAYGGEWGAERVVFKGDGEPRSYIADEEDRILVDLATIEQLSTIDNIHAHFAAADIVIPPLRVGK